MPPTSTTGSADAADPARPDPARPDPAQADPRAGFVLMEVIPVLIIVGLALVLALPSIPRGTTAAGLLALAVDTASLLRAARTEALAAGRETTAVIDRRRRTVTAAGQSLTIPRDVDLAVLAADSCRADPDRVGLLFRADGTSCGGVVRYAKGARAYRVRVNWATGHVAIQDGG